VFEVSSHASEMKVVGLGWDCLYWRVHTGPQVWPCSDVQREDVNNFLALAGCDFGN